MYIRLYLLFLRAEYDPFTLPASFAVMCLDTFDLTQLRRSCRRNKSAFVMSILTFTEIFYSAQKTEK